MFFYRREELLGVFREDEKAGDAEWQSRRFSRKTACPSMREVFYSNICTLNVLPYILCDMSLQFDSYLLL